MTSGKILATVVGITAAVILISQLSGSISEPNIVENFLTGGPAIQPAIMSLYGNTSGGPLTAMTPAQRKMFASASTGKKLTTNLPNDVFFGNAQYQPNNTHKGMMGAANYGATVQALMNQSSSPQQTFRNFEAAAGVIEGYHDSGKHHKQRKQRKHPGHHKSQKMHLIPQSSPFGCGPEGTVNGPYGAANSLGSDFHALNKVDLPTDGFTGSELPAPNFSVTNADGTMSSHYSVDRLMYSTAKRARCAGTVDFIRGDLAIAPCPIASMPAARAYDTLEAGAFGALFGLDGSSAKSTIALISDSKAKGGFTALAGADMADLVQQAADEGTLGQQVLTQGTFANTSALSMVNLLDTESTTSNAVGTNTASGDLTVYTGYSDFQ